MNLNLQLARAGYLPKRSSWRPQGLLRAVIALILAAVMAGCAIKLVDDFDSKAVDELSAISQEVFAFYDDMIEADAPRPYRKYAERYSKIETRLRVYALRQAARPLNEESAGIAQKLLDEWIVSRDFHKERSAKGQEFPLQMIGNRRDVFSRYFKAALIAEEAKKLASGSSG